MYQPVIPIMWYHFYKKNPKTFCSYLSVATKLIELTDSPYSLIKKNVNFDDFFYLEFYNPVNTVKAMSTQSVNLIIFCKYA